MDDKLSERIRAVKTMARKKGLRYHSVLTERPLYVKLGGQVLSDTGRIGTVVAYWTDYENRNTIGLKVEYTIDGELVGQVEYQFKYNYVLISKHGDIAIFIEDGTSGDGQKR